MLLILHDLDRIHSSRATSEESTIPTPLAAPACYQPQSVPPLLRHAAPASLSGHSRLHRLGAFRLLPPPRSQRLGSVQRRRLRRWRNRDCDVLIFGDSTAMTGINPDVIERNTGFKTCNIAVTNAVLAVTDNLTLEPLSRSQRQAPRPARPVRPDGFQPESHAWRQHHLRRRSARAAPPRHARSRPPHPPHPPAGVHRLRRIRRRLQRLLRHQGRLVPHHPPAARRRHRHRPQRLLHPARAARTSCEPAATFSNPPQAADFPRILVERLSQTDYADRSGIVLVNVAPIPSCDQNLAAFSSRAQRRHQQLPRCRCPSASSTTPRHYTAVGSTIVSRLVAQELNAVASRNPAIDDRTPHPADSAPSPHSRAHLRR